jgi:hypothetical protein
MQDVPTTSAACTPVSASSESSTRLGRVAPPRVASATAASASSAPGVEAPRPFTLIAGGPGRPRPSPRRDFPGHALIAETHAARRDSRGLGVR